MEGSRGVIRSNAGQAVDTSSGSRGISGSRISVLVRPMRVASKISAIEAIRYQGQGSKKKKAKERKGYQEPEYQEANDVQSGQEQRNVPWLP